MVQLAAVDPDGLGVVDENVVDGSEWLHAGDGDEARFQARASRAGKVGGQRFAGRCERRLSDGVVLRKLLEHQISATFLRSTYLGVILELHNRANRCGNLVGEVLQRAIGI